jgi:hypothetical protein
LSLVKRRDSDQRSLRDPTPEQHSAQATRRKVWSVLGAATRTNGHPPPLYPRSSQNDVRASGTALAPEGPENPPGRGPELRRTAFLVQFRARGLTRGNPNR